MRGWYDIKRIDGINRDADIIGIEESISRVNAIVASQVKQGIESHKIILMGFPRVVSLLALVHCFWSILLLVLFYYQPICPLGNILGKK